MLRQLTSCFGRRRIRLPANTLATRSGTSTAHFAITEKPTIGEILPVQEKLTHAHNNSDHEMSDQRVQEIALSVTDTLMDSTKTRERLQTQVNDIVHASGWWSQALATKILALTTKVVEAQAPLGSTMTAAYHRALDEASKMKELAESFAHEHPVLTTVACVVIALGILYLLAPWVLEVLGFTELGPLAGSWAARWQSVYGEVPIGSLFSYLQRLGMTWHGGVVVVSKL